MNKKLLIGISAVIVIILLLVLSGQKEEPPITGEPKALFGIVLTQKGPTSQWTDSTLDEAFEKARSGGFNVAVWTNNWGSIEPSLGKYNWDLTDIMIGKTKENGFKFSLSLELAQIADMPNYPEEIDFTKFDNPAFISNFTVFTRQMVNRYKGKIDYLWIGQEVDYYLHKHPEQKEPFLKFFQEFEDEVKSIDPNITVGIVGGYHLAREVNEIKLLQELADKSDVLALTIYPESEPKDTPGRIKNPSTDTQPYFDELFSLFAERNIAIHETAWSSNGPESSKEKQAEYVRELSKVVDKHKENIEFLSWYLLYDMSDEDSRTAMAEYGVSGEDFFRWQGSLGLLNNNGKEKPAWQTWKYYMLSNATEE